MRKLLFETWIGGGLLAAFERLTGRVVLFDASGRLFLLPVNQLMEW